MSKEIQKFIENLKDWKNNFPMQDYDYTKYNCEVANIVQWQKENNINELINFWNEKLKEDFFELKHPIYNNITTRAVYSYFDGNICNYIFMMDKDNRYPWILFQDSHLINSCILPNKILKIFSFWNNFGRLNVIKNILLENDKVFFYNTSPFALLLNNRLPRHYFFQVFASLCAIGNHVPLNKKLSSPAFFVLKEHKKQIASDEKLVYIYPNLNADNLTTFELARKKIYNNALLYPGIYYQKDHNEYDLKVWFGFPSSSYRDWIEKYQFATLFISQCGLYFKKIKIYVDGITAYEGEKINDERNNAVYKILKEQIIKVCKNENIDCALISLAGYDYRTKICYCNDCDIAISEGNTTALVPFNFCKIPGVNFIPFTSWSMKVGTKIVSLKNMARVYTDINKADGLSSYHIPPQHIYNLAAEVLEELSAMGKLKIKNLRMHRLDVPPVELLSRQYNLEQELKIKEEQIQSLNQKIPTLELEIAKLTNTLNSLPVTKQNLEIKNLEQDVILKEVQIQEIKQGLINKQLQTKKLEKEIENEKNALEELQAKKQELEEKNVIIISKTKQLNQMQDLYNTLSKAMKEREAVIGSKLSFCLNYVTAKSRIQNQLSYKLGQAMIANSKSILGYIRMPFVLSYIKDKHKQEQKIYQEKIKKDPSLKLPPLESYPDYKEALKEKECLTYKLGESLIKANKTWYKGGYVRLIFEIRKLKKEFGKK